MFWKYNTPSVEIEALLQKEDVSLQELMEKDELLQECKTPNRKVIDFLTQSEVIEELVLMIVNEPSNSVDLGRRFKNANLAAELLSCDALIDKLVASSDLLQHLYKFFHNEKPLNPILASFVSKVFATPVQRKSEQNYYSYQLNCFKILEFIKSKDDFVDIMVNHVGTSAIMDFLSQLISGVEDDEQEIKNGIHRWLDESCLVEKLVYKLSPEAESEEHASVDSILCEISHSQFRELNCNESLQIPGQNILSMTLESEKVINKMLDILLKENWSASSVRHVINIIITLFSSHNKVVQNLDQIISTICSRSEENNFYSQGKDNTLVVRTVMQRLSELQDMLLSPCRPETIPTAFGIEMERLGSSKLQIVTFVSALICTNYDKVHQEMALLCTIELLLDLFYKFSLNNFLHTQVTQAIVSVLINPLRKMEGLVDSPFQVSTLQEICKNVTNQLENKSDDAEFLPYHPLLEQLFTKCHLAQRLLADLGTQEINETEKKSHNVKGYMGHLRLIANTIKCCSTDGRNEFLINKYIDKLPNDVYSEWEDFIQITLAELNLKNEVIPIKITNNAFDSDSDDDIYICAQPNSMLIINKDFKIGDMETSTFHDVDAFRAMGEGISEGKCDFDDAEGNNTLFEKMCSEKNADSCEFEDMWKFQEKEIKFPEMIVKESNEDEVHESSSDEEDERFTSLKSCDDKIDADDDGWSEVFDKRAEASANNGSNFNPWHWAAVKDTSENSWAQFEGNRSTENDPFFLSLAKASSNVVDKDGENIPPPVFDVDFRTAFTAEKPNSCDSKADFVEETSPVCDSKLSSDDCMLNSQESSTSTLNN